MTHTNRNHGNSYITRQFVKNSILRFNIPLLLLLVSFSLSGDAFHQQHVQQQSSFQPFVSARSCRKLSPTTSLKMSNPWDDFRKWISGDDDDEDKSTPNDSPDAFRSEDLEALPAGTTRLITLPVQSIKPGGLRLFLMFYLMGLQNTPEKNTWRANQGEDYVVDFRYHDQSALLSIELKDSEIIVDRVGSTPSTAYMMQESVVVEGLLDELLEIENAPNVSPADRLLQLQDDNAIEKARSQLSFG